MLRYGNTRELCLGLEVVTAQGEVWDGLTGLRKDNTGYDLRQLFIGSEGTLGIITARHAEAVSPARRHAHRLGGRAGTCRRRCGCCSWRRNAWASGLTGFEVMGRFALSLVAKHVPQLRVPFLRGAARTACCWRTATTNPRAMPAASSRRLLEAALEDGCATDAVVAENLAQAHQLWHVRESIPLAQAQEGLNIKHDISVPISRIPAFCAETDALLAARDRRACGWSNFGHLGDGNLHYNVQAPEGGDAAAFLREQEERVNTLVYDQVHKFGGSISAEHGIGELKAREAAALQVAGGAGDDAGRRSRRWTRRDC